MKKKDVIDYFGSQACVAGVLSKAGYKVSQPAISKWPEEIPELRAFQIEKVTGGKLNIGKVSVKAA